MCRRLERRRKTNVSTENTKMKNRRGSGAKWWKSVEIQKYERTDERRFVDEKAIVGSCVHFAGVRNHYVGLCLYGCLLFGLCGFVRGEFSDVLHLRISVRAADEETG